MAVKNPFEMFPNTGEEYGQNKVVGDSFGEPGD